MFRGIGGRLTYANVVSTLALFLVVTGGVAWAAVSLTKNSVKTRHIAKGAVTSAKIKDHAVHLRDLAGDVTGQGKDGADGLQGPRGEKGEKGDTGAPGAPGADATIQGRRMSETITHLKAPGNVNDYSTATVATLGPLTFQLRCSREAGGTGWHVRVTSSSAQESELIGAVEASPTIINGWDKVSSATAVPIVVARKPEDSNRPYAQNWLVTVILPDGTIHDVRSFVHADNGTTECIFPATAMIERVSQAG